MERDERGREVRRRRAPGRRAPVLDDDAWPELGHSPYTFEGRIEQLGVLARGLNRRGRRSPAIRAAGWLIAAAMLLPILLGLVSLVADGF